jgi:putative phosphoesterase
VSRLVLVLGDTHIPDRATSIPRVIANYISEHAPWELVLFTGDLTGESVLEWLKTITRRLYVVRGNMDYLPLPRQAVVEYEWLRIGLVHGDGIYPRGNPVELSKIAKKLNVQLLVSGHTHADFARTSPDSTVLLLNPGSLTGVWGGGGGSYTPSFMVIEVLSEKCIQVKTYLMRGGSLEHATSTFCAENSSWRQLL